MGETIRCMVCRNLFKPDEIKDTDGCPICGYQGLTMLVKGDVNIDINWLELRIICTWAEQFALQGADEHSMNAFYSIIKNIMKQLPEHSPITYYNKAQLTQVGESDELPPKGTTIH